MLEVFENCVKQRQYRGVLWNIVNKIVDKLPIDVLKAEGELADKNILR